MAYEWNTATFTAWASASVPLPADFNQLNNNVLYLEERREEDIGYSLPLEEYYDINTKLGDDGNGAWASKGWGNADAGVYSADTTLVNRIGNQAASCTGSADQTGIHIETSLNFDLFNNGASADNTHYIRVGINMTDVTQITTGIKVIAANDAFGTLTNYMSYTIPKASLSTGFQTIDMLKSNFSANGTASFTSISGFSVAFDGACSASTTFSVALIDLVRKDPDTATPNQFQRNINGTWVADAIPDATANYYVGFETTTAYNKIVCRNLSPIDSIYDTLLFTKPYNDFKMSTRLTARSATFLYDGLGFKIDANNRIYLNVYANVLYLGTKTGGGGWVTVSTALTVAVGDNIVLGLEKRGTVLQATATKNDGNPITISTTFTPSGVGYMATASLAASYQNIDYISITNTSHSDTCNTAKTANDLNLPDSPTALYNLARNSSNTTHTYLPSMQSLATAAGTIFYSTGASTAKALDLGTSGQYLKVTTAGDSIEWVSSSYDVIDAAGDLILGTADNTVTRLAVGTANQSLRGGATASWGFNYDANNGTFAETSSITASGSYTKNVALGASTYRLAIVRFSGTDGLWDNGGIVVASTTSASATAFASPDSAGNTFASYRSGVLASLTPPGTNTGGSLSGHTDIYLADCFINSSNLTFRWTNSAIADSSLGIAVHWEVLG